MKKAFWFFLVYFMFHGAVFAASFDCSKASTDVEKLICSNNELSRMDDDVSLLYAQARSLLYDKELLKKDQIRWIKETRSCNLDYACIYAKYVERREQLSLMISTVSSKSIGTSDNSIYPSQSKNNEVVNKANLSSESNVAVEAIFEVVKSCFQNKDYLCAKQKLEQILSVFPDNKLAKVGLLNVIMAQCVDKKDYQCAIDAANKWALLTPDDQRAFDAKEKLERAHLNAIASSPTSPIPSTRSEYLEHNDLSGTTDNELNRKYEVQLEQARLENKILTEKVESQKLINELRKVTDIANDETELSSKSKTHDVDALQDVQIKQEKIMDKAISTLNKVVKENGVDKVDGLGRQENPVGDGETEFSIQSIVLSAIFGGFLVYLLVKPKPKSKRSKSKKESVRPPEVQATSVVKHEAIYSESLDNSASEDADQYPSDEPRTTLSIGYIPVDWESSSDGSTTIMTGDEWHSNTSERSLEIADNYIKNLTTGEISSFSNAIEYYSVLSDEFESLSGGLRKVNTEAIKCMLAVCMDESDELDENILLMQTDLPDFENDEHDFNGKFYCKYVIEEGDEIVNEVLFVLESYVVDTQDVDLAVDVHDNVTYNTEPHEKLKSNSVFELVVESSGKKVFTKPLSFELVSSIVSSTPDNKDNIDIFELAVQHPSSRVREMVAYKDNLSPQILEQLINDRSIDVLRNLVRSNYFRSNATLDQVSSLVPRDTEVAKSIAENAEYFDEISAFEIAKIVLGVGDPSVIGALDKRLQDFSDNTDNSHKSELFTLYKYVNIWINNITDESDGEFIDNTFTGFKLSVAAFRDSESEDDYLLIYNKDFGHILFKNKLFSEIIPEFIHKVENRGIFPDGVLEGLLCSTFNNDADGISSYCPEYEDNYYEAHQCDEVTEYANSYFGIGSVSYDTGATYNVLSKIILHEEEELTELSELYDRIDEDETWVVGFRL